MSVNNKSKPSATPTHPHPHPHFPIQCCSWLELFIQHWMREEGAWNLHEQPICESSPVFNNFLDTFVPDCSLKMHEKPKCWINFLTLSHSSYTSNIFTKTNPDERRRDETKPDRLWMKIMHDILLDSKLSSQNLILCCKNYNQTFFRSLVPSDLSLDTTSESSYKSMPTLIILRTALFKKYLKCTKFYANMFLYLLLLPSLTLCQFEELLFGGVTPGPLIASLWRVSPFVEMSDTIVTWLHRCQTVLWECHHDL